MYRRVDNGIHRRVAMSPWMILTMIIPILNSLLDCLHVFDRLDEVHHQMNEEGLVSVMRDAGYRQILQEEAGLPNGKKLVLTLLFMLTN